MQHIQQLTCHKCETGEEEKLSSQSYQYYSLSSGDIAVCVCDC